MKLSQSSDEATQLEKTYYQYDSPIGKITIECSLSAILSIKRKPSLLPKSDRKSIV